MQLRALIYGRKRVLEIVGIASSPEFVFAVAPGAMLPEPERFGVVWMGRESLGRAFDVDGAFNDVVFRLVAAVRTYATRSSRVDALLERHGGRGAYGRDRMLSAQFLADELTSLRTMAAILPPIFMLVAVFLLNVSLSRLVATERSNIGLLKSFGYGNAAIAVSLRASSRSRSRCSAPRWARWSAAGSAATWRRSTRTVYRIPGLSSTPRSMCISGPSSWRSSRRVLGAAQAVFAPRSCRPPPRSRHPRR